MNPYIHITEKWGRWHSFFAVRLASVTVFDPSSGGDYRDFAFRLLNRQIDFINSLDCPEDGRAFDLRFICRPDGSLHTRGSIDVVLISMVSDAEKEASLQKASEVFHDLWSMLAALSERYEFECMTTRDDFLSVYDPFTVEEIVEIMRREDVIEIGTAKRLRGFSVEKERYAGDENRIYFVYPFIWSANSLARLFSVMLFQDAPCLLSISLKPVDFSDEIERFFVEQIELCERYLALESQARSPVNARIEFITKTLQSQVLRLEDSPFLMKIRIASSGKVRRALIDSFGVEITEHAGSPDLIRDSNDAYVFSGGYDWHCFSGSEAGREAENMKYMRFAHYAGTLADKKDVHVRYLFDATQANCAFRLPLPRVDELPGMETRFYRKVLPPSDVPSEGIVIGKNIIHGQTHYVRLSEDDRRRHMYVVGQTGTGKSTLFLKMILQDIDDNRGVAVIDPHGELISEIMPRVPKHRIDDVVYVNFEDMENPVAFNMLEYRDELERDFVVNQMFEIFAKLYDLRRTGGPMFEQYMKNALFLVMDDPDSGSTLLEVQKVFSDSEFRRYKLSRCRNRYIREFWESIASKAGGESSLENMAPYITSKLSMFIYNNTMRNIISSQKSSIDMRRIMDSGKILLVDLCKGKLGSLNSHFLGMILIYRILMAALGRRDVKDKNTLKDFYLYVDEFQNLATDSFISILSEARKYRLSAILTNQYLTQVPPEVQSAITGNVGTIMSFRVGMADAEVLEREFYPVFTKSDLLNLPNWRVCVSMLAGGEALRPFGMQTIPVDSQKNPDTEKKIRDLSGKRYGRRPEEIEKEIAARWMSIRTPREQIEELLKDR